MEGMKTPTQVCGRVGRGKRLEWRKEGLSKAKRESTTGDPFVGRDKGGGSAVEAFAKGDHSFRAIA